MLRGVGKYWFLIKSVLRVCGKVLVSDTVCAEGCGKFWFLIQSVLRDVGKYWFLIQSVLRGVGKYFCAEGVWESTGF